METKLKKFVEEQFTKIKKSKKSPKNFDIFLENGQFGIDKSSINNITKASYEGNLYQLYTSKDIIDRKITPKVEDKYHKQFREQQKTEKISQTKGDNVSFCQDFIDPLKAILKVADFNMMTYSGNIKGVSKEIFIKIQNWVKSN